MCRASQIFFPHLVMCYVIAAAYALYAYSSKSPFSVHQWTLFYRKVINVNIYFQLEFI
jgi:hypothetical protein